MPYDFLKETVEVIAGCKNYCADDNNEQKRYT